jgi:parvulin-like peptidyl-prolyl isomerase
VFDTTKFIAFLNNPAIYENEGMLSLEKYTKDFLVPMQTLRFLVALQNVPTASEVAYEYRLENEKAVFEYASLSSAKFQADPVSDAMISSYYQAHQDSFATEEQVGLYFVKIPKAATAADDKATYREMVALRDKINNNDSNFAEEARLESDDEASGAQGGELGWVSKGQMVPEFEAIAFSAQPHAVSMPIKTRFGYHLILVEERQKKDGTEQVKARHILRKIIPSGETMDKLNALADSLHAKIVAEGIKSVTPKDSDVFVDSTGLFGRGDAMPKAGYVPGAAFFAFQRAESEVSELLESDDGFFIFQVNRKIKKGTLPLSVTRDRIAMTLSEASREAKARAHFDAFLKTVPDKNDVAHFSKSDSLVVSGATDTVGRTQYIPGVGFNNQAVAAAFALPDGKVSPVIGAKGTFFVVKPLWHRKIAEIPWQAEDVAALKRKMAGETGQRNFNEWYLTVKSGAKIVDQVNQFYIE